MRLRPWPRSLLRHPCRPSPQPAVAHLQDAQSLSIDSDFKPFASRAVAPEVRNAAMKKLFTDPTST